MIYALTLPLPPSVNSAYGGGSGQQRFKSASYKRWLLSCPAVTYRPLINYPVELQYDIYLPDARLRDIANYEKLPTDFLVKNGILEDDNFNIVKYVSIEFKGIDKKSPRVEINIKKI